MATIRHMSAKRAWARMEERAERGEKFGFIACLGLMLKLGFITRAQVLERLQQAHITQEDLQAFRRQISWPTTQ